MSEVKQIQYNTIQYNTIQCVQVTHFPAGFHGGLAYRVSRLHDTLGYKKRVYTGIIHVVRRYLISINYCNYILLFLWFSCTIARVFSSITACVFSCTIACVLSRKLIQCVTVLWFNGTRNVYSRLLYSTHAHIYRQTHTKFILWVAPFCTFLSGMRSCTIRCITSGTGVAFVIWLEL